MRKVTLGEAVSMAFDLLDERPPRSLEDAAREVLAEVELDDDASDELLLRGFVDLLRSQKREDSTEAVAALARGEDGPSAKRRTRTGGTIIRGGWEEEQMRSAILAEIHLPDVLEKQIRRRRTEP